MNIKRLKILTVIFLAAANICFAVMLAVNFRNKNYYDFDTIENIYKVMESSGIDVAHGILERRQPSFYVYTGVRSIASCEDILLLYGEPNNISSSGEDVSVISRQGRFDFYRDGSFSYHASGYDAFSELEDEYVEVSAKWKLKKKMKNAICDFLKIEELKKCESNRKSVVDVDVFIEGVYYESATQTYKVTAYQTFDGDSISEDGMEFLLRGEKIISAGGTYSFVYPTQRLPADCFDTMNIMIMEKTFFGENVPDGLTLSEITYFYNVYDSTDGNRYFIPMCCVFYNKNGVISIYNLVSGKRE